MAALGYDAEARVARAARARRGDAARRRGARAATADARRRRRTRADAARDVVVIGTGAGGARRREGARRGAARASSCSRRAARHDAATLTARPRDMMARLYRDGGQIATLGRPPIVLPLGRGVGGTTLVNSGTCFRTPDRVLDRWGAEYGLDALDAGRARARVRPRRARRSASPRSPAELAGANAALVRRGAERARLVRRLPAPQRARLPGQRRVRLRLPDGRQAAHRRHVPRARARRRRAHVHRRARASGSSSRGRRATAVEARTARRPPDRRGRPVVVAAGTIHTPVLLGASGLGGRSGQLGRNLSLHPATAVWGAVRRAGRHGPRRPAVLLRRRVRRRRDHARGDRRPARLPGAGGPVHRRPPPRADAALPPRRRSAG